MIKNISKIAALATITFFLQIHVLAQAKQDSMAQLPNKGATLKSITIHQEVDFKASPEQVYEALLDTKQFCEFSVRGGRVFCKVSSNRPNRWRCLHIIRWTHCWSKRRISTQSANRSSLARRGLASRRVFDRQVRT